MRRIDDPSAAATLPVPESPGTEGYFTEGLAGVTPATLVRASFLNLVQEELRAIVVAGGLTPSKTTYNQVLLAIEALIQQSAGNYALDTGTANIYQVAYAPAVTAVTDGMVLKFRAKFANTAASTFAPNAIAAAPIWGGDHAAVGGGEIIANGDVWVQWNSSLNGGSGAWLLLDSTGGFLKSPTPAQFDNSTKLATTAFLKAAGLQLGGRLGLTAATTLTAATAAGKEVILSGAGIYAIALPPANTCPSGTAILMFSVASAGITVNRQGADTVSINAGTALTTFNLLPGESALLVSDGNAAWDLLSGSAQLQYAGSFGASLASNGYQKLPSGLIEQWGVVTSNATPGALVAVTFPIAFPSTLLSLVVTPVNPSASTTAAWAEALTTGGFAAHSSAASQPIYYIAKGK